MMKQFNKARCLGLCIILTIFQLLNNTCSRSLYPLKSFSNIESSAERSRLGDFFNHETEMALNTLHASPRDIIETARKYLGVPHCMGGRTIQCMDCSGLVAEVFAAFGIHLPHNSEEQARYGKILTGMDQMEGGDLVFFIRSYDTRHFITHSGIYIGNNEFVHASTSRGVTITSIYDPWWKDKFLFGTRVFESE